VLGDSTFKPCGRLPEEFRANLGTFKRLTAVLAALEGKCIRGWSEQTVKEDCRA
jgi:hypothetical protein